MHDHDLDLIAAYADGTLEGDSAQAERLIATCEECRDEYRRQRQVKELLGALPPVTLTDIERHRLHAELRRELTPTPPEVVTPPRPRRTPRWMGVAAVAAGFLVVVVGVGTVVRMGGLASGGVEAQLAEEATTTAAATAETSTTGAAAEVYELAPEGGTEAVPVPGEDLAASTTTTAGRVEDLGDATLADIEEALAQQAATVVGAAGTAPRRIYEPLLACTDRVEGDILAAVTAVVDGTPVEAYLVEGNTGDDVVVLTVSDCRPLSD